ncbi:hypothetical protein [Brevibacillus sp. HD3.3A]|uniref:hypothetical protein n=1 Tax=Brevibacillus sp. HD3.3A TaxID=2738979 RepID=UPI00156B8554|nr:hypothetical protein [Brevibacillus sp. HD3.3A]UED72126.1 hypothetical protein HP435_28895 [Brevibacillus sp. HD3.3A]
MGRNKYTRCYLMESSLGQMEQMAPSQKEAIVRFKTENPTAKKVKVVAVMTAFGWHCKEAK